MVHLFLLSLLEVVGALQCAGHTVSHMTASFGTNPSTHPVTAPLVSSVPNQLCPSLTQSEPLELLVLDETKLKASDRRLQAASQQPHQDVGFSLQTDPEDYSGKVVLIQRGNCSFYAKALLAQDRGAVGVIIGNNLDEHQYLKMLAPDSADASLVTIPVVFVLLSDYQFLQRRAADADRNETMVTLAETGEVVAGDVTTSLPMASFILVLLPLVWCAPTTLYLLCKCWASRRDRVRRHIRARVMPVRQYRPMGDEAGIHNDSCAICLEDFSAEDRVKVLPCLHGFHPDCVNPWLQRSDLCPVCKHSIMEDAPAVAAEDEEEENAVELVTISSGQLPAELGAELLANTSNTPSESIEIHVNNPIADYDGDHQFHSLSGEAS